jgi:hypothetical protein
VRVLIDTNVLVSAILRDKDPQTVILWIAGQDDWEGIVTPEILAENREVLVVDIKLGPPHAFRDPTPYPSLPYFLKISLTLPTGSASTLTPSFPVIVSAAASAFTTASSTAWAHAS